VIPAGVRARRIVDDLHQQTRAHEELGYNTETNFNISLSRGGAIRLARASGPPGGRLSGRQADAVPVREHRPVSVPGETVLRRRFGGLLFQSNAWIE
jgi:hypothetical protein